MQVTRSPDAEQGGGHYSGRLGPQAIFSQCYRNKTIFYGGSHFSG
jgi:hypothetical protein